ncbi:MAG: DUF4870 domain-containing protein [Flavobacteriales bacterium]|nr:DUF4870 domain-containing protein [Flavobacteriales bacterium]
MEVLDDNPQNEVEIRPWGLDLKTFNMLMHLSQLAGAIVPFAGFAMPIIMWATQKDKDSSIDTHGKNIINFMISYIIYAIVCVILVFIVVGIFGLIAIGIASLIFIIIGAVRASENRFYEYPLSIRFLK